MKKISIEYCTSWGYLNRAVSLAAKLLNENKKSISELTLIPSSGGVFEVELDSEVIFSKKELERYPEENEIEELVQERL